MSILARTTFLRTLSRSKKMKVRNHENVVIKKEGKTIQETQGRLKNNPSN